MPRKLSSETLTDAQLEELAAIGFSDAEISNLLAISESTFKAHYTSVIKRGRGRLRKSLRRAQVRSALSGNSTMLVWLGKQYLGQSDRLAHSVSADHKVISITPNVLERLHASHRRTMEQLGPAWRLPAATEEAPTFQGTGGGVKTRRLSVAAKIFTAVRSLITVNSKYPGGRDAAISGTGGQLTPAELATGPPEMRSPSWKPGRREVSIERTTIDIYPAAAQLSSALSRLACRHISEEAPCP